MSTMTHKAASLPRGRIIEISPQSLFLLNEKGTQKLDLKKIKNYPEDLKVGDWVTVENSKLLLLTPNRKSSDSLKWPTQILDPRRRHAHRIRTQVQNEIRGFFLKKAFLEVRTPLLVASPGMEPHIRPFQVHSTLSSTTNPVSYLPTSPEFAMKKLLAGGLEKIFQITPAFRDEPHSITHLPEFTLLEWYRSFCGYEQTMKDTEELVAYVAKKILKKTKVPYQSKTIDVSTPWPRYAIRSLFKKYVSLDLGLSPSSSDLAAKCQDLGTPASPNEPWDDLYFKIWLNHIEPKLPQNRAFFVLDYPPSQAALSVIRKDKDGSSWAKRFEAYIGGIELCNAFEELTDPTEQRKRFVDDMNFREELYGKGFPKNPIDEDFMDALTEGLPPCSGNALGVDRLIMLIANESDIRYTVWLP